MRRIVGISAALLICSLVAQEGWGQSGRVTGVRQASRTVVPAMYAGHRVYPYGSYGGDGCGCDSCGGGCGVSACDSCCETSCCSPCLLPRLVHGVGRAIHNLFSCHHCCADTCGGCSAGSCCAAPTCGASYGGCSGCSSCGGGSSAPYDVGNPFLDDAVPEAAPKSPAVPKDARIYRSMPGQSAAMRSSRPVIVGPVKVSPPRVLNPQASTKMKSVKAASYQTDEPTPARVETKVSQVSKSRKSSSQNPLRDE